MNDAFIYQPPTQPWLTVLYQDDDFIILNKSAGLLSVPGRAAEHKDSLALRVQRVLPTSTIVHRLDMATSGIMVMALHKEAHRSISRQFQDRETSKTYYARVLGIPAQQSGEINLPLRCDWPNRPRQIVDHQQGKNAVTQWEVESVANGNALIKLTPITGRSHQLRVHMQQLGHAILGDELYATEAGKQNQPRLMLHAQRLGFSHPGTLKPVEFICPHPF